jgi:hypothetical protein
MLLQRLSLPTPSKLLLETETQGQGWGRRYEPPSESTTPGAASKGPTRGPNVGKRRTRITIETDEIVVARRIASPAQAWCARCGSDRGMVTPSQAAWLRNVDRSAIQKWMESGELHVLETADGARICLQSLLEGLPTLRALNTRQGS